VPESESVMAISTKDRDDVRCIFLTDVVDIAQASELKQALSEAIGSVSRVSIEVSGATAIDVTTAQLLWAAVSYSSLSGTEIVVQGPWSAQVEQSFLTSGLTPLLQSMVQSAAGEGANVLASRH
jgi:anti-anti-sigma regulatory factor